jgi:prepilin-type N-terminal cleavage/methylation domain-containing protein
MRSSYVNKHGFTIVELLIVIVVIGILAAISVVAYNGITKNAQLASMRSVITQLQKSIELYRAQNGVYPATQTLGTPLTSGSSVAFVDANCDFTPSSQRKSDWIPGLGIKLPQGDTSIRGAANERGCYMYVSNGEEYVLSAWNLLSSPNTGNGYRRLGFRESHMTDYQRYLCNHSAIGGRVGSVYDSANDYYKYSYTISNITTCNETPPAGA